MNNIVKLGIFFIILLIGFGILAIQQTFYKPLPDYNDTIVIEGLSENVEVNWDDFGVPHVYAANEEDLYFTVGYLHAQDRLWQMTLSQIAAEGRFAEFFGEDLIEFDRYQRTLGFYSAAKDIEANALSDNDRRIMDAYSEGVNSFIDNNGHRLPIEFSLTGIEPIRWNRVRVVAMARLMAWELNMGWWTEVMYNHLKSRLSDEQFEELRLRFPDDAPTSMNDEESLNLSLSLMPILHTEQDLRKKLNRSGSHVGSNAWVVDGSKTISGYPMLAGDPHMGLDMPGKWYELHLNLNERNISGATLPGIPVFVLGQNESIAWSFTSIMSDDTDFFIEKVDPLDRSRYVADSLSDSTAVYEYFDVEKQIIKVKDGDEQVIEIRKSKHGPIISDIHPDQHLTDDHVIAMQWTGYELSNEFKTLYEINWANNFQEFQDALPSFGVPGLNLVYGDVAGNIAMFSTGKLPLRRGDPITFRNGWEPENDWDGWIPFEKMPKVINPERGWIANANNKLHTENYPYYIATFWEPPSRIERISNILAADTQFTFTDFGTLQNDSYSEFAKKNTPVILDIIRNQNVYNFDEVVEYLENWDFKYENSATAASLFDAIFLNITKNTLTDEFGEDTFDSFLHHENIPVRTLTRFMKDGSSFFDNTNTEVIESKDDIVLKSIQDAILFLSDSLGNESFNWRWEQLHTITFEPPLFSQAAEEEDAPSALKLIVNNVLQKGPYPAVGHGMSVNNGQYSWEQPFEMVLGPSIRRIVDFSDMSATYSILSTGQSGNPLSSHYGDQIDSWLNGNYRNLHQDSSLFVVMRPKKMILKPEN